MLPGEDFTVEFPDAGDYTYWCGPHKSRNDRYGTRRMRKFNTVVLDITVAILDFLYRGRDYQRFWVLRRSLSTLFRFLKCITFS